jgi:hypothetical protein
MFLYAAGNSNGKLAVYSVNQDSGALAWKYTHDLGEADSAS